MLPRVAIVVLITASACACSGAPDDGYGAAPAPPDNGAQGVQWADPGEKCKPLQGVPGSGEYDPNYGSPVCLPFHPSERGGALSPPSPANTHN